MPADPVPEADRLEQDTPASPDAGAGPRHGDHPLPPDAPDADVFEQELPLLEDDQSVGIDAERTEPVSDEDWATEGS
jgi:hypothetical protein